MGNSNNQIDFLNYINKPMSKEGITMLYGANNIKFERCELYNDFVQSLLLMIFDTYMGDTVTNSTEQVNHFNWCWNKNIENFKSEGVVIEGKEIYDYFLSFMLEVYYPITKKDENINATKNILKLWLYIFDYNNLKPKSDLDTLIDIYQILEKSIKIQ